MTSKPTHKIKDARDTTKCLRDITDIPPSAFALPNEGRKAKYLQGQRKSVAQQLARYANADGTQAFPSIKTLMKPTGYGRSTIFRVLKDLKTLGFLQDGAIHDFRKTRVRTLDVQRMIQAPVQDSSPSNLTPVQDSPSDPSKIDDRPVQDSRAPVQDRHAPVQDSFGTQPSYRPSSVL